VGLTDNTAFPTLAETAVSIKTQNNIYGALLARMSEGSKQVTLEKNQSRAALETLLSATAIKVQDISNGDELLIGTTGFEIKRKPAPIGLLDRPTNVTAKPGPSRGSLEISWDVVPNAYIYELQYTDAPSTPDSKWIRTSNTKRKIILENLIRGNAYAIKVAGAGSDPGRVWSDEIVSYVM